VRADEKKKEKEVRKGVEREDKKGRQ